MGEKELKPTERMKRINFDENYIVGSSGKKYFIGNTLTVGRYQIYEDLEIKVHYGRSANDIFKIQKSVHELLNQAKFADASIENWNCMSGIKDGIEKRYHPVFYLCSLFMNTEDEDISKWEEEKANEKIKDWEEYAAQDFFQLAFNLVIDYFQNSEWISQSSSPQKKKEKDNTSGKGRSRTKRSGQK